MSRTKHLTHAQWVGDAPSPSRSRARARLTKPRGDWYAPNTDRPKNAGAWPGGYGTSGRKRRVRARVDKVAGKRRERRRRNRGEYD